MNNRRFLSILLLTIIGLSNISAQNRGNANGHEWIDLGLPSGTKWATCNVGATTPEDYGKYFAWGETTTKTNYTQANSKTFEKSISDITGKKTYDVATANWGNSWRIPTKNEFDELKHNCTWQWVTQNGRNGYKVTSKKNNKSIFLPATGYKDGSSLEFTGEYGCYWFGNKSTSDGSNQNAPYILLSSEEISYGEMWRYMGMCIRPIYGGGGASAATAATTGTDNGHKWVDLGLPSGIRWATCNIGATTPGQAGKRYAWGETKTKASFTQENSKTWRKKLTDIGGNPEYDAARANWGGNWRMPTEKEFNELLQCCNFEWTTQDGKKGYKFTSTKNNNSIFLPATGVPEDGNKLSLVSTNAFYWTSTPKSVLTAYHLIFGSYDRYTGWSDRSTGGFIRAVSERAEKSADVPHSGEINGHKWVDLGLPSGTKWATCNMGAKSAEICGDEYKWGEVKTPQEVTSFRNKTDRKEMTDISGRAKYDAATAKWGATWRIPTKAEMDELLEHCTWEWTNIRGRNGYKVSSKVNGNYIFLPCNGDYTHAGDGGSYWTSTPMPNDDWNIYSYYLSFGNSFKTTVNIDYRYYAHRIRPVSD